MKCYSTAYYDHYHPLIIHWCDTGWFRLPSKHCSTGIVDRIATRSQGPAVSNATIVLFHWNPNLQTLGLKHLVLQFILVYSTWEPDSKVDFHYYLFYSCGIKAVYVVTSIRIILYSCTKNVLNTTGYSIVSVSLQNLRHCLDHYCIKSEIRV